MMSDPLDHPDALTADDWELVKNMVFSCLSLERQEQRAWLNERCPPGRVRNEVERLLAEPQLSPSFMALSAPQQVLGETQAPVRIGHFRVEHTLGAGGMGIVYAAVDERLGRQVALKVLQPDTVIDEEHRKRLLWDARAASALNHPNIVCVYEAGEADGVEYVAMELVPGGNLADLLEREALPQLRALALATQIAGALEAAHAMGIVHRDVKPSNVMITGAGVVKLVDFGLAKGSARLLADKSAPTTVVGRLAGTVAYMSPEQAETSEVDFRSDVFSFGSVFYEMLTRRKAFVGGSSVSVLAQIIHGEAPSPSDVLPTLDPRLEDIVERCLRKSRERRFQSMGEVRLRIQEVIDEPVPTTRARAARPSRVWGRAIVAAAAAAGALAAVIVLRSGGEPGAIPTLSSLTWDSGLTTYPAISRDGTLLAYASDRHGRGDLDVWLQKIGGSDPIRLTTDAADDSAPAVSPDGTQVAYRSERGGGGVYVIPSLGGTERLLAPGCRDPKYSPDGKWIACWTGDVGGAFYPSAAQIWLVSASGGPLRQFRPDFQTAAFPLWLPDGTGLLFLGRKRNAAGASIVDWWVASESGGERASGALAAFKDHELTPAAGWFWIRPEAWIEQGPSVLFTARHRDATNVWALDMSLRGDMDRPPRALTRSTAIEALPTTPSGTSPVSLVFASLSVDAQLRRVPLTANLPHRSPERLLPALSQIGSPSVSADGRRLVFSARQTNGYRVVSVDTATADQRLVTTVESPDFVRVILSGDGQTIVYGGANSVGYHMNVSGGLPEPICGRCGWPTHVSFDGSQALFESAQADERLQIWSKGVLQPLIAGADANNRMQFAGRFSPDNRWVAISAGARDTPTREIFVVPNAPGRELSKDEWVSISEGQTSDREPYWAPDGRQLFFISDRDGFRCIWARPMDARTAKPSGPAMPIARFHHARELLRSPVPSFGGIGLTASADALIFTVTQSTGNLWWQRGVGTQ